MNSPTTDANTGGLSPELSRIFERGRKSREEASFLLAGAESVEAPIEEWDRKIRASGSRGRKWRTQLTELQKAVSGAGSHYVELFNWEQVALQALREAIVVLKEETEGGDTRWTPECIQSLTASADLRAKAIEWIAESLQLTEKVTSLGEGSSSGQVASLLELRKRYMEQVGYLLKESEIQEADALQHTNGHSYYESGPDGDDPSPAEEPGTTDGPAAREPSGDVLGSLAGLEDRIRSLRDLVETEHEQIARSAAERIAALEAERDAAVLRAKAAERERDEALVLVNSLAKRLQTPGVDED